jgi:hypothetical protein
LEGPARLHRPIGSLSTKPVPADEMIVPFASRMLIGSPVRAFGTSRTEDHPPKSTMPFEGTVTVSRMPLSLGVTAGLPAYPGRGRITFQGCGRAGEMLKIVQPGMLT